MPSTPKVLVEYSPKGPRYPQTVAMGAPPVNLFTTPNWVIGATSVITQNVTIPALTANVPVDVTFSVPFSFPRVTLGKTDNGVILAACFPIGQAPDATTVCGAPSISVTLGQGNAIIGSGTTAFQLQSGGSYSGAYIGIVARIFSPAGTGATQHMQFGVQALIATQSLGTT